MTPAEIRDQQCIVSCACGATVTLTGEDAHDLRRRAGALVMLGWSHSTSPCGVRLTLCPECSGELWRMEIEQQRCAVHCECGARVTITGSNAHDLIGRLQHLTNLGWTDRKCPRCSGNEETARGQLPLLTV